MKHDELVRLAALAAGAGAAQAAETARLYRLMADGKVPAGASGNPLLADLEARIRSAFDFTRPPTRRMTSAEVLAAIGERQPSRSMCTAVGLLLPGLTGRRMYRSNGRNVHTMPDASPK